MVLSELNTGTRIGPSQRRYTFWLIANITLAAGAAWGANQGNWPSVLQIGAIGTQVAQLATAGFLVFTLPARLSALSAGILFGLLTGLLAEHFDDLHESSLLTALRFRHDAIDYCVGLLAGWHWSRATLHAKVRPVREGAFSLKALLLAIAGVGGLLSLRAFCPDSYENFQRHGFLPMLPFYWPVSISLGIAAAVGLVAALSRASVKTRVVLAVLTTSVLGLLPPYYYYGAVWRASDLCWSLQMLTIALLSAIASISFEWARGTKSEAFDASL